MAKSETNPQPAEPNRGQRFLAPHRTRWLDAFKRAKEAAETTGTPAWAANFQQQAQRHQVTVKYQLAQIEATIEAVRSGELSEDHEKAIKDAVKALGEHRARYQAWVDLAVQPFREAVDECGRITANALRLAKESEAEAPLTDRGLLAEVEGELAAWPKPRWDEENGLIVIE